MLYLYPFKKILSILFTGLFILFFGVALSACGYHLRGYTNNHIRAIDNTPIQLIVNPSAESLHQLLVKVLSARGFDITQNSAAKLHILDVRRTRQTLNGAITEVQIGLEADVVVENVQGEAIQAINTLRASRNYQYDIKNSNTDSDMQNVVTSQLEQDITEQITRQLQLQVQLLNSVKLPPKL